MITATARWAYDFYESSRDMRELLGGKGAAIAEMTRALGPDVAALRRPVRQRGPSRIGNHDRAPKVLVALA